MSAELIRKAKRLARIGRLDEARRILLKVTQQEPENEAAWIHYVDLVADNDQERLEALRQYLSDNPDSPATSRMVDKLQARQTAIQASLLPMDNRRSQIPPEQAVPAQQAGPESSRPATPSRFRQGPTNVAPRLPPGTVTTWFSRGVFVVVLVSISLLAVLPLWDGRNLFSYLSVTLPNLSLVQAITTRPPVVSPTPGPDSVLFAELDSLCPQVYDLAAGARLEDSTDRLPTERAGTLVTTGLVRYLTVRWRVAEGNTVACELFVYQSLQAAQLAFGALVDDLSATGVKIDMGGIARPSAANLIEGPQYVYNLAYRQERVVVSLSSTNLDRDAGKSALEQYFRLVAARLGEANTG